MCNIIHMHAYVLSMYLCVFLCEFVCVCTCVSACMVWSRGEEPLYRGCPYYLRPFHRVACCVGLRD